MRRKAALNAQEMGLLREVVARRAPQMLSLLEVIGRRLLTEEEREELREVVLDEFLEVGLRRDYEPNAYGLQLSEMIECLGDVSEWK